MHGMWKSSHFLPSGQALQRSELRRLQTTWHRTCTSRWRGLLRPRPQRPTPAPHSRAAHRAAAPPPLALHRAANDRRGKETAPRTVGTAGLEPRPSAPRAEAGDAQPLALDAGLGRTSLSGTHCGSSKPNGLPKARCSGTMRRPLGERTSFLASRRAATPEDMSPPEPLTPPPAPSPERAHPPRPPAR